MKSKEEKGCKNCKHFLQYYIKPGAAIGAH